MAVETQSRGWFGVSCMYLQVQARFLPALDKHELKSCRDESLGAAVGPRSVGPRSQNREMETWGCKYGCEVTFPWRHAGVAPRERERESVYVQVEVHIRLVPTKGAYSQTAGVDSGGRCTIEVGHMAQ